MNIGIRAIIPAFFLFLCISCNAVSAATASADSLVAQGDALMKTRDYTGALAVYEQAISLDKRNYPAWNGKADALNRAGNFSDALAASDTVTALEPSRAQGWINRGYILYNLGRFDEELKAYDTAISLEPDNADAWFNKGYSLAGLKRYDEAIAAFDKVRELRPDYPKLDANRGIAEQLRDAGMPWYIRYAPIIAGIVLLISIAAGYHFSRKKTVPELDTTEKNSRQGRRRKERKSE